MLNLFKEKLSLTQLNSQIAISDEASAILKLIKRLVERKCSSSLKLYVVDSGSCNGCELELQLLFSPLYDLSSHGVTVVYDITKADALLITGLMTENMYSELNYLSREFQLPHEVILVGDCPIGTTLFQDTFALKGEVLKLFPRAFHIGGCPPTPLVLLDGFHKFLEKI